MADAMDFFEMVARRKLGVGADWRWCSSKVVGVDWVIEGGVPRVLKSGPRKGSLTWNGTALQSCVITKAELQFERSEYEKTSGKCWECQGRGEVVHGWSKDAGTRHKTCSRCGGRGAAPGGSDV
jgi:hypothetical protein